MEEGKKGENGGGREGGREGIKEGSIYNFNIQR